MDHARKLAGDAYGQVYKGIHNAEVWQMSFKELQDMTGKFSKSLGEGGFGAVYKGEHQNGEVIAVKRLKEDSRKPEEQFKSEVSIMRLKHKNIVRLKGYCCETREVVVPSNKNPGEYICQDVTERLLCYEFLPNGSLDRILNDDLLDWQTRHKILEGICEGLHYLHEGCQDAPIVHMDLKPANVLLDDDMVPKLADFGLSRFFTKEQTHVLATTVIGSRGYIAPEFVATGKITTKSDIYSLGVLILEIATGGMCPNKGELSSQSSIENVRKTRMRTSYIVSKYPSCETGLVKQVKSWIQIGLDCVDIEPTRRPTIVQICERMQIFDNSTDGSDCKLCDQMSDYRIPDYMLEPDSEQFIMDNAPCCPVIVFINPKTNWQLGSSLIKTYRQLLNEAQVIDLSEEAPDKVLHRLYANFEKLKSNGDVLAALIQKSLRLIVAGGDGTANWLLGVVSDLKLSQPPPVAIIPIGKENNFCFSFGWGNKKAAIGQEAARSFLRLVKGAREMYIDSWHIIMRMRAPWEGQLDDHLTHNRLELPHSLHAFQRVSCHDSLNVEGYHTYRGGFWNYFSVGKDAHVSYEFHSERKRNTEKVEDQRTNKGTYAKLGFKEGRLATSLTHKSSSKIAHLAKVKIMRSPGGRWECLAVPPSIQSFVCLNLPSFAGGLNPWGVPGTRKFERDLTAPYVDDGLIEIVGFRKAWHNIVFLAPNGHGIRLAQVYRVRFEFHKGEAVHTFMRIDGEPWKQPLPLEDDTVVIEISHHHQVTVLATGLCRSKSVNDPMSSSCHGHDGNDDSNSSEDEDVWKDVTKSFGATAPFRFPEEIDIAHLS